MVTSDLRVTPDLLKNIPLFSCFSDSELSELIQSGEIKSFESHANLVIEGEMTSGLYILLEGIVGVFKSNPVSGELYDVGQLRQGNFFGEISLIEDAPRSATVRALTASQTFCISKETFHQLLSRSQDLKIKFLENCLSDLVHRLREVDENYVISQFQLWKSAIKKEAA